MTTTIITFTILFLAAFYYSLYYILNAPNSIQDEPVSEIDNNVYLKDLKASNAKLIAKCEKHQMEWNNKKYKNMNCKACNIKK
jgi:hypothetical protein